MDYVSSSIDCFEINGEMLEMLIMIHSLLKSLL